MKKNTADLFGFTLQDLMSMRTAEQFEALVQVLEDEGEMMPLGGEGYENASVIMTGTTRGSLADATSNMLDAMIERVSEENGVVVP